MRKTIIMYPQTTASSLASDTTHSDSRYTVADILSSMANGGNTPSTMANFEGFSTGVLTQTTPTLTPTTLRNIEQTFIELQTVPPQQIQHQNQAGFVTPIVNPPVHSGTSNNIVLTVSEPSSVSPPASTYHSMSTKSYSSESSSNGDSSPPWSGEIHSGATPAGPTKKVTGRNMGGRRPARHEKLSPEEEERRRVRRERNKLAAARCRKRRLDHTNCLITETEILDGKRADMVNEIQELTAKKEELEFILEAHKLVCKLRKHNHNQDVGRVNHQDASDVKPILSQLNISVSSSCTTSSTTSVSSSISSTSGTFSITTKQQQPSIQAPYNMTAKVAQRPTTLQLTSTFLPPRPHSAVPTSAATSSSGHNCGKLNMTEETGIVISTPSKDIFNYDALMEGGTGLTPISSGTGLTPLIPNCSSQQRSSGSDLASPDTITPTSKLVSL